MAKESPQVEAGGLVSERGRIYSTLFEWQQRVRENPFAYVMLIPLFLYVLGLVWYPFVQGLYMSFFNWPLGKEPSFVGFQNYLYLLTWPVFWQTFKVTLLYGLQIIGHMFLGITMALVVWQQDRFKGALGAAFLLPYIIPHIVTGTLWRYILAPLNGPFFKLLMSLGFIEQPVFWLNNGTLALAVTTLIGAWTWAPVVFLLVLAGLEGIPSEFYETAEVYGANTWQRFWNITFPQVKSTILLALALRMIWNLSRVSQLLQITRGGPGYQTTVMAALIFRLAWLQHRLGRAFAVGILLGLISLSFAVFFVYQFEKTEVSVEV